MRWKRARKRNDVEGLCGGGLMWKGGEEKEQSGKGKEGE